MERRTQPGYEYHSCDFMDDGVYIDMNLLREYEDTGLSPEQILELKGRNTAMEIKEIHVDEYYCPACGAENICEQGTPEDRFCPICGQRLKPKNGKDCKGCFGAANNDCREKEEP